MAIILSLSLSSFTIMAQEDLDVDATLRSRNYSFIAETVSPMSGRTRQLTTPYDLQVKGDTLIADLPYFGRAFSPTYNMSGGGIEFTSTDYDFVQVKKKKKRWEISFEPRDAGDVRELVLTVFSNGRADLRVSSNSRQGISYRGYIEKNGAGR